MPKNNYTVERVKPNESMMKNSLFAQTVRADKLNSDTLKWKLILRRRDCRKASRWPWAGPRERKTAWRPHTQTIIHIQAHYKRHRIVHRVVHRSPQKVDRNFQSTRKTLTLPLN